MNIVHKYESVNYKYEPCSYLHDIVWSLPNQDFVRFNGSRTVHNETGNRWEAEDYGRSISLEALSNTGEVELKCEFKGYDVGDPTQNGRNTAHSLTMTIQVINDLVEVKRCRIVAPSVGNPMLTPQLFLISNCGNQIYLNTSLNPNVITNCMVSATIQNTFSPSYAMTASGDAPVKLQNLSNLSFELVDGNLQPIKLLNQMTLTLSVSQIPNDEKELEGMLIPKNSPTPEQKAQQDAEAQRQQEAQAKADAEAKVKADTNDTAMQLIVQYFGPLVQQQQAIAAQQQQQAQVEQNKLALLQDPGVVEALQEIPKDEAPQYLDQLAQQMLQQQLQEQQQAQAQQAAEEEEEEQQEEQPQEPTIHPFLWDADNIDKTIG
jgi:hypothetical protein